MINEQQEAYTKKHHERIGDHTPELDATRLDRQFRPLIDIVYKIDKRARHSVILCALDRFQQCICLYLHVQTSGGDLLWFRRGTGEAYVMQEMLGARTVEGPRLENPPDRMNATYPVLVRRDLSPEQIAEAVAKTDSYYCVKCTTPIDAPHPDCGSVVNLQCKECSP